MMKSILPIAAALLACGSGFLSAEPEKERGINLYQIPASASHPDDAVERRPGFMIHYSPVLKSDQEEPFLESADEVRAFAIRQKPEVRENGVWIVIPAAGKTTDSEKRMISTIRESFRKGGAPLFTCEADKLPGGWVRWDEAGG